MDRPMYLPLTWIDEEKTAVSKKIIMVEAISMYRMRYAVECADIDTACDLVKNDEVVQELSQLHLGETITSARELTEAEYLTMFDADNDYLRSWSDDRKFALIHKHNAEHTD